MGQTLFDKPDLIQPDSHLGQVAFISRFGEVLLQCCQYFRAISDDHLPQGIELALAKSEIPSTAGIEKRFLPGDDRLNICHGMIYLQLSRARARDRIWSFSAWATAKNVALASESSVRSAIAR